MPSFEYFKDHVPIVQVAEALGYVLNKKAGRNPLEYKHPDHNTIVISNRNGRQRYFTRHESENRGSVIDFVKHRLALFNEFYHKESEGINKVLASFSGVPYEPSTSFKNLEKSKKHPFDLKDYKIVRPQIGELLYLSNQRGLSEDTLSVFLPYIHLVQPMYTKSNISHIGFPYLFPNLTDQSTKDKWIGFELVNYLFKGHARGSDKANGLWAADLSQLGSNSKRAYIAESAIDAMSFYQLFRHKYKLDEATFLSTGGYVTDHQIRNLLNAYPRSLIHTLFDNDLSGHLYDIRTACMKENKTLQIQKTGNHLQFKLDKKSIVLPEQQVTLSTFRKESGLRPDIRVHKATGKDFNEMLTERANQRDKRSSRKI